MDINRGDIFYADLDPIIGSEQGGFRPVVVVQNDIGNKCAETTIVAAVTSQIKKCYQPTHVLFGIRDKEINMILLEQLRTVDVSRLKEYVGRLTCDDIKKLDKALTVSVGLIKEESR